MGDVKTQERWAGSGDGDAWLRCMQLAPNDPDPAEELPQRELNATAAWRETWRLSALSKLSLPRVLGTVLPGSMRTLPTAHRGSHCVGLQFQPVDSVVASGARVMSYGWVGSPWVVTPRSPPPLPDPGLCEWNGPVTHGRENLLGVSAAWSAPRMQFGGHGGMLGRGGYPPQALLPPPSPQPPEATTPEWMDGAAGVWLNPVCPSRYCHHFSWDQ